MKSDNVYCSELYGKLKINSDIDMLDTYDLNSNMLKKSAEKCS